jgi:hypothetical protein
MSSEARTFAECMIEDRTPLGLVVTLTADIVNFKRMSHAHARDHYGPTIIQKAASMGVQMTANDLDHLLQLCLGIEVQIEPFDRKVYDYHL